MNHCTTKTRFDRIAHDPEIMQGQACTQGMRITVDLIANLAANGMSPEEILDAYPYLEAQDIQQAIAYQNRTGERL